jgi:hypothetical protein
MLIFGAAPHQRAQAVTIGRGRTHGFSPPADDTPFS